MKAIGLNIPQAGRFRKISSKIINLIAVGFSGFYGAIIQYQITICTLFTIMVAFLNSFLEKPMDSTC
jgi:uncharacterized membrane protein